MLHIYICIFCFIPPNSMPPSHTYSIHAPQLTSMQFIRTCRTEIVHEDFMEGLTVVQAKKKATLSYYA